MTEQVRLTGDRTTDALDDSIAFSRYTEAIDRINTQYGMWSQWQVDLQLYIAQKKTASTVLQSVGYNPLSTKSSTNHNIFSSLPTLNETQQLLDDSIELARRCESLIKEAETEKTKSESSLQKLKGGYQNNEELIDGLRSNKDKLLNDLSSQELEDEGFLIKIIAILLLALLCIVLFVLIFINFPGQTILLLIVLGVIGHISESFEGNSSSSKKPTPPPDKEALKKSINSLEENLSRLLSKRKSLEDMISNNDDQIRQYFNDNNQKISQIKREILSKLENFSQYVSIALNNAENVSPIEFKEVSDTQKLALGRSFAYWEHGAPALPFSRMLARPWEDEAWTSSYQPQLGTQTPDCIRIGNYLVDRINPETNQKSNPIEVPAMIPVRAFKPENNSRLPGHIVIFSNTQTRDTAIQLLESIATRLISTFPVRTLKGSFIDPIALGNTFPFKGLPKSILSGQQIFTRNQDIREELKTLVTHVEQVIQNYLGRTYETLEDYNNDSQSIAEPYRYLFIADFPTAFDSNTADELKSLITNGGRAGVYSIIHVDTSRDKLRDFDYDLFDQYCTVIRSTDRYHEGNQLFELRFPDGWKRDLLLDRPPSQELHQHIIQAIAKVEKTIKIETVNFTNFYPETLWQSNSQQELRAPIGLTGAREQIEFWLGENDEKITVSSGLLAGKPGAGKSYTLHSIILSLAMQYSPDELELYLLDYKEGVEFQIYVDPNRSETQNPTRELDETRALPHAKVISIESDREFGLSVLQRIQKEIETRGQLFKDIGVSELKDYRQKTGKQIPRVLVVIDEFQYMFQDNDAITRDLNQLYEDITRRGRSFGVHLLLASQSLNINNINNRIYGFIPLRMAMQMDQTTANIVLAEGNTEAVELLDRSGRIIYNTEFGRKRKNQLGQIADVSLEARRNAMNHIHEQVLTTDYQRKDPIVIFQGNRPSKITQNGQLQKLAKLDRWLPSSQLNKQTINNPDWLAPEVPSALWIGEAMRIGHHTSAILRRRARSNMLLIGQSESSIFGMISGALLSLVHIHKPQEAEFHIIDLSQTDDNETLSEMTTTFQTAFQNLYPIKLGKRFPDSTQNIKRAEKILEELYATLQTRKQIRDADPDTLNFGPSIFFIAAIGALSRAQYLRPIAGPRNADEMSSQAKQLQELTTLGPELGIHTLLWLDNATTFNQLCANLSPRNLLSQFDCRTVLKLSAEDSRFFLGETVAQNLPSLRGYFYDASLSEGYEKFKPYAIPSSTEITQYAQALTNRPH